MSTVRVTEFNFGIGFTVSWKYSTWWNEGKKGQKFHEIRRMYIIILWVKLIAELIFGNDLTISNKFWHLFGVGGL